MKKKLVIFDWGGVLQGQDSYEPTPLEQFLGIARDLGASVYSEEFRSCIEKFYQSKGPEPYFDTDKDSDIDEYLSGIIEMAGLKVTLKSLADAKEAYVKQTLLWATNYELVQYAHSLKDRGVAIGLLSNLLTLDKLKQDMDVNRAKFDYVWLSCDVKFAKPYFHIYEKVMADLAEEDYDILFIDDREENLEIPKELEWKTFHMRGSNVDCMRAIEDFLRSE